MSPGVLSAAVARRRLRSRAWDDLLYWALDVETTGLDARRHAIVSVGMVPVRRGAVRAGEGFYTVVRGDGPPAGPAADHILPAELEVAPALAQVLPEIDARLHQGVLLAHHAPLDVGFLRRAYRRERLSWPRPAVVDTAELVWRRERRRLQAEPSDLGVPMTLAGARALLGLPPHTEHHALSDAVATAELFTALVAALGARTLGDLLDAGTASA